jgi:hypothetical protein
MKLDGLIEEDEKNWTRGKHKRCSITEKGTKWLIDVSLFDFLGIFSSIFANSSVLKELKKPRNRQIFQKLKKEKYSQTISLTRRHFIECAKKGVDPFKELESLNDWEYKKKFKILDMEKPLYEALEKLNILITYLLSDISWEEAVQINNTHIHIFSPRMKPWFSYRPNSNRNIDSYFLKINNEFKKEISRGSVAR